MARAKRVIAASNVLNDCGFDVSCESNEVKLTGRLQNVLKLIDRQSPRVNVVGNGPAIRTNLEQDPMSSWTGGSLDALKADLSGEMDMTPFNTALSKIKTSEVFESLKTKVVAGTPMRKRRVSEHDGEWDMSRQWEIAPFHATYRAFQERKAIDINAQFAFNGAYDPEEITAYGAMIWAISELIESAGIRCRVVWCKQNKGISEDKDVNSSMRIELKAHQEYVAPSLIAAAFQARFYRRAGFALIVAASDYRGYPAKNNLGTPRGNASAVSFVDGALELSPAAMGNGLTPAVQKEILKALGL